MRGCRTVYAPLTFRNKVMPADGCLVMGILNRTPDSFYDRGATFGLDAALARADQLVAEGAHIVDIGGVKAGPGDDVDTDEEIRRVLPLVEAVRSRHPDIAISVDTFRASVADAVCAAGADLINDAWQAPEPAVADVAAKHGVGLVCTHAGGHTPRTRPHRVEYDDVVTDVVAVLGSLAEAAVQAGVRRESILIDPGHDFGKNSRHSLAVTAALPQLVDTGWPVLVALSRKSFLGEVIDAPADDRLEATLAATAVSAWLGARVFRAHDVAATVRALKVVDAIAGRRDLAVGRRGLA
ncbi:MAG: dihydropteroate synthase [Actinomycetota bacterium]|jgi:dihydropteroate synthase|nr:dihydropteroate synthase [Actinomycetota bacterium]